jgi:acyl-CoA thioesterase FadM
MRFLREASVDDRLRFETTVLGADQKRLHFVHLVVDDDSGDRLASVEQMAIHVDTEARRSSPVLSKPHEALRAIVIAHSASESPIIPTMTLG